MGLSLLTFQDLNTIYRRGNFIEQRRFSRKTSLLISLLDDLNLGLSPFLLQDLIHITEIILYSTCSPL